MFITKKHRCRAGRSCAASAPRSRCRCSTRWCPRCTALAQTAANPQRRFGVRLLPERRDHGSVDSGAVGRGLRVLADPEAARAVPESAGRREQPRARRHDDRRPRRGGRRLADRRLRRSRPRREDVLAGITIDQIVAKQIGQDTPFPSLEVATEDFTGFVGGCTPGLQLRLHEHDFLGVADDAAADGDQSAGRVRADVRPRRHGGAARASACGGTRASSTRSRTKRARCSGASARATARGSTEYLDNIREIERRIQRTEAQQQHRA